MAVQAIFTLTPMNTKSWVSAWIKEARRHAGWTQDEFGALMSVSKQNVSAWENAHHEPSITQMLDIAARTDYRLPAKMTGLAEDEEMLVMHFRELTADRRAQLLSRLAEVAAGYRAADQSAQSLLGGAMQARLDVDVIRKERGDQKSKRLTTRRESASGKQASSASAPADLPPKPGPHRNR